MHCPLRFSDVTGMLLRFTARSNNGKDVKMLSTSEPADVGVSRLHPWRLAELDRWADSRLSADLRDQHSLQIIPASK